MNRFLSSLLGLFRPPPKPPTREELICEWEELLEWLREEDIPLPEKDAPIGSYLTMPNLDAESLKQLQAHEKRLRLELETIRGNGACYKMSCLRIVVGLQAFSHTQQ